MTPAERKQRQREREKAKREQAAFAFDRPQEQGRRIVTSQVTERSSHSVTSKVTVSTPAAPELACGFCGKGRSAVPYMFVASDWSMCSKCAEGDDVAADAFDNLDFVMRGLQEDFFEQWQRLKIDLEQLAEEVEACRREREAGRRERLPEADEAFAARAQQHLRALIAQFDELAPAEGSA